MSWRDILANRDDYRIFFADTPVQIFFNRFKEFDDTYLIDILSVLDENFNNLVSLRVPLDSHLPEERLEENLEKAAYLASEIDAEYISIPSHRSLLENEGLLIRVHDLLASYKVKLCLESVNLLTEKDVFTKLMDFPRGVFKLCYDIGRKVAEGLGENEMLNEMYEIMGLLKLVYIPSREDNSHLQKTNRPVNIPLILEKLGDHLMDVLIIIDTPKATREDLIFLRGIEEKILSILEKRAFL
mgnify:CR=1 FL=1